jgi:hypothetical protein
MSPLFSLMNAKAMQTIMPCILYERIALFRQDVVPWGGNSSGDAGHSIFESVPFGEAGGGVEQCNGTELRRVSP